jgi:hypothetical protein
VGRGKVRLPTKARANFSITEKMQIDLQRYKNIACKHKISKDELILLISKSATGDLKKRNILFLFYYCCYYFALEIELRVSRLLGECSTA